MKRLSTLLSASLLGLALPAIGATPGFVEDFAVDTGGFGLGGGSAATRVTSGGVGGVSDPYLSIANVALAQLGSFSDVSELVGDLPADGVTGYSFWLRDTGANNNHEIHVAVGQAFVNVWLSIPGFVPPDGSWQQFSVDLTNPSQWIQIIGTGTFQSALAASNRLLFRHDLPPLTMQPNTTTGDFGLDRIQVLPAAAAVPTISAPGQLALALLVLALAALAIRRTRPVHPAPSA
jgi:hypothetical protein